LTPSGKHFSTRQEHELSSFDELDLVLGNMLRALDALEQCREFSRLMPEVRVNIAFALKGAKVTSEIAAIDGRISVVQGFPKAAGLPRFGVSDHLARLILEARKYDPSVNACINFRCDGEVIETVKRFCKAHALTFGFIDRTNEPEEVMARDGASMPWKVKQMVDRGGVVPRLFYEGDGWGKEPLFVALGSDAVEVVDIACAIARDHISRHR
jgi:hydroxymethylpyrimidine/phosphomethylpyrimidine kinase